MKTVAEELHKIPGSKEEQYQSLIKQLTALTQGEKNMVANLANIAAALKYQFDWWWIGFYLVQQDELVLGPFQGPVACTRIQRGRGVCGTCWQRAATIVVKDVHTFPGHIACSSASNSEIVVPVMDSSGQVIGVLDADSEHFAHFDNTDKLYLEKICGHISTLL